MVWKLIQIKLNAFFLPTPNFDKRTESFQITIDGMVKQMEDQVKNLHGSDIRQSSFFWASHQIIVLPISGALLIKSQGYS